ncbi:glutaredoxin domain-containing protein [Peptococcaceae bacterium 1198_IL3148]
MVKAELYTWSNCPYCQRAKVLLEMRNIPYTEHNLDNNDEKKAELYQQTGQMTVPFVFINGRFIGGFSDLKELDDAGKLDTIDQ